MRHKHKCDACATVWEHERRDDVSEAVYHKLHDCPKCGQNQRTVYFESESEQLAWRKDRRENDPIYALLSAIFEVNR